MQGGRNFGLKIQRTAKSKTSSQICWVKDDRGMTGYLSNSLLHYEFEGETLLAATTRSRVVTPYGSYSPLLLGTYFQHAT
jgi:hypothetical protein